MCYNSHVIINEVKRVKIFTSNESTYVLEVQVNDWLERQLDIEVVNMSMTCDSEIGEYCIAILYKEAF